MKLVNGQFLGAKRTHVSAPSPAEIAERAYGRAVALLRRLSGPLEHNHYDQAADDLEEHRDAELAALRDEVLNPPTIRSKR